VHDALLRAAGKSRLLKDTGHADRVSASILTFPLGLRQTGVAGSRNAKTLPFQDQDLAPTGQLLWPECPAVLSADGQVMALEKDSWPVKSFIFR
jgi:hypothetical protein